MNIDGTTKIYGILGNPVSHSLSPVMHNTAFAECGINGAYLPFHTDHIEAALQGLRGLNIRGVSVTIPHKEGVIPFLDQVDPVAKKIGSVNTIVCLHDGETPQLHGYNTDWIGANRALRHGMELEGADVVILGAGGSARAIGFGLIEAGARIVLCSRTESRGRKLAEELDCQWVSLVDAEKLGGDAMVNATSVGMVPDTAQSPVPPETVENFSVVMDIIYAPLLTRLLEEGKRRNRHTINGLEMLLYQGVAQFELWTGRDAPVEKMRNALMMATGNAG